MNHSPQKMNTKLKRDTKQKILADFLSYKAKTGAVAGGSFRKNAGLDLKKFDRSNFEFGSKLGKGKYGDVYIARERKTNLIVSIKVLDKQAIRELKAQKQVRKEVLVRLREGLISKNQPS